MGDVGDVFSHIDADAFQVDQFLRQLAPPGVDGVLNLLFRQVARTLEDLIFFRDGNAHHAQAGGGDEGATAHFLALFSLRCIAAQVAGSGSRVGCWNGFTLVHGSASSKIVGCRALSRKSPSPKYAVRRLRRCYALYTRYRKADSCETCHNHWIRPFPVWSLSHLTCQICLESA